MRSIIWSVATLMSLGPLGCSSTEPASLTYKAPAGTIGLISPVAQPGDAVAPDAGGSVDDVNEVGDATLSEVEPDLGPDTPPDVHVPPVLDGGESDGTGIIVEPEALEGLFVYGIGTEPGSLLSELGPSAAGIIALPAVVELVDERFVIRVYDDQAGAPVPGQDGLIESYPYQELEDGRLRVDFTEPVDQIVIQLWQSCQYELGAYSLEGEPVYADSLLTWPASEVYQPANCGGWSPNPSFGTNVHFLRRADANPDYQPRAADPAAPFGYFLREAGAGGTLLTRLPHADAGVADGQLVYLLGEGFPDQHRPAAEEVFEGWNDVFEAEVGVRPFLLAEGTHDVIPWDPRYRVVNWDPSSDSGAIAPFIEDPFTGEIFESDVTLWLGSMEGLVTSYSEFFEDHPEVWEWQLDTDPPPAGGPSGKPAGWYPLPEMLPDAGGAGVPPRALRLRVFPGRPLRPQDVARAVWQLGLELDDAEVMRFIFRDFLTHEIGHNVGLRHNFKGSLDRWHKPDDESSTTTMDYVVGMPVPGTYDADAVAYAYGDGADELGYEYCTDEHVELDPGCCRWDYGHPVGHWMDYLDALAEEFPPGTSNWELDQAADEREWYLVFRRIRQYFNTDYEQWEPEAPMSTFEELLFRVVCADPCTYHTWFRSELALYTLYTRYVVADQWHDFPELTADQAALLMATYYDLVLDAAQPQELKLTIIGKLPTANVPGAGQLLSDLETYLSGLATPTAEEQALLQAVQDALAQ